MSFMDTNTDKKKGITPANAVKILEKNGIEINESKAEIILDFLYFLAKLTVNQSIKDMDGDCK